MYIPMTVMFWYGTFFFGLTPSLHLNQGCLDPSNPVLTRKEKVPGSILWCSMILFKYIFSNSSVGVKMPTTFPSSLNKI